MNPGTALAPSRTSIPTSARAAAGCVLVLTLWLGLLTAAPPAAADPRQEGEELRVELTEMSPAVLRPGDDLTIRGLVHNDSAEPVTSPSVELIMQRQALSSRTEVDNWHHGTASSRIGTATPFTEDLEEDLEPRSATQFTITMPSAPTFAETSPWGPRGIEVNVEGIGAGGSARSLLLWFPAESPLPAPAELSVLMPLTPTSAEWQQAATQGLPVAAAAADRLTPLLAATQDQPVSWALDPALLEPLPLVPPAPLDLLADPGTDDAATPEPQQDPDNADNPDTEDSEDSEDSDPPEPTDPTSDPSGTDDDENGTGQNNSGGSGAGTDSNENGEDGDAGPGGTDPDDITQAPAPSSADTLEGPGGDLVAQVTQGAQRRDVLALGYADADLGALAHARDFSLWRLGQQRGSVLLEQAGVNPLRDVLLPAGRLDGTSLDALVGEGVETVVTPESTLDPAYAPMGHGASVHVDTTSGPVHALVPDERISALLTGHDTTGSELDALTSRQLLLAETAAAVREDDQSGPGFLATLPRDVAEEDLDGHLADLAEVPWMDLTNLRGLLGRTPGGEPRTTAAPTLDDPARLPPDRIADLEQAHDEITRLATTLPEPPALLNQFEPALLTALSGAWARNTPAREDLMDQVQALTAQLNGAVRVEPGSSVLLINHSGDLPVTVANDLPVPARVTVALAPQDPRLRAGEPVQAVLEPETITTVRVPIQAVANGNVHLDVQVLGADGEESVGEGTSFMVRVRADWEDIGTAVVAALLAVGFVIGLVRTIRSGRRRFNPSAPPSSEAGGPAR